MADELELEQEGRRMIWIIEMKRPSENEKGWTPIPKHSFRHQKNADAWVKRWERSKFWKYRAVQYSPMADELERIPEPETMTDAELDAELREHGIDPEKLIQNVFQKVCVLAKTQAERIADLQAKLEEKAKPKCPDCNAVGMGHCSDPLNCGGVYWPDHLYKAQEAEIEQLKSYQANYEHATQIERADAEAELQQEREDARRIISLRQDRIDVLTAELGNVRTQWNRMRIAKERAEAKNAALEARLETLTKAMTEIHGYAIYGCGTKQKDVRGKQFSAIEELARPFSNFLASRSQQVPATEEKP